MSASSLLSIDAYLVTPNNPPRTSVDGMDYTRCAALHNYLVDYCLAADCRPDLAQAAESSRATLTDLSTHGETAEAVRPRLHPSVAAFLAAARICAAPLFYFVAGMPNPDGNINGLFANETADLWGEPEDSIVRLYFSHMDACDGESGGGMLYHQRLHRASFFVHPDDTECAFPVDEHRQSWHPLEAILSNWVALIRLGKVVASPADEPALYGGVKIGNWEWRPYGHGQIAGCVAAWDRLCGAIEVRRRQDRGAMIDDRDDRPGEPLLTPGALPAPRGHGGFRRRPALHPPTPWDGTEQGEVVPPVYMFFSDPGAPQVDVSGWRSSFRCHWDDGHRAVPEGIAFPSRAPPGVYSECVVRSEPEAAEEAFRLLLPSNLYGARRSSGAELKNKMADELFQHGFKPFGGNPNRPQRLERLLDHWANLVQRGVWSVGPHGVQGSIDVFKDATVNWVDYTIPSSW
ncbi:hypothetical protein NEMBOFW57_006473 [Staphylotrichum longicolle]|uniref:Uncharacterized protein n=1 Tax=Staphylotrichum longicolle TaxID=669026 RepID=A0AAD4EX58_9PEZI|nr:hypothetical protein NEMBOFW57_006473 [Staphylotrichum longicolle]